MVSEVKDEVQDVADAAQSGNVSSIMQSAGDLSSMAGADQVANVTQNLSSITNQAQNGNMQGVFDQSVLATSGIVGGNTGATIAGLGQTVN